MQTKKAVTAVLSFVEVSIARLFRRAWPAAGLLLLAAGSAAAQDFPARPLRVISPFPANGAVDQVAHFLLPRMQEGLGQPLTLENRDGNAGTVGTKMAAAAPPDGYTLLVGMSFTMVTMPNAMVHPPYDPVRDFAPVGMITSLPYVLVASTVVPARTMPEMLALLRGHPGGYTYASKGIASGERLTGELFKAAVGAEIGYVDYKAVGPAIRDLRDGNIGMMFLPASMVVPARRHDRFNFLAVTSRQRLPGLPEVPTMAEAGLPDFEALSWYGLFAPAGTPPAVIERLNTELNRAVVLPQVGGELAKRGFMQTPGSPQDMAAVLAADQVKWGGVIKPLGLKW